MVVEVGAVKGEVPAVRSSVAGMERYSVLIGSWEGEIIGTTTLVLSQTGSSVEETTASGGIACDVEGAAISSELDGARANMYMLYNQPPPHISCESPEQT